MSGRVVDEDGHGVSRASIRWKTVGERSSTRFEHSAADGTFAVKGIEPGRYHLKIAAPNYRESDAGEFVIAAGEDERDVEVTLHRGAVLAGQVVWDDGDPVAHARIRAAGNGWSANQGAVADHRGRFTLRGLEPGRYRLLVRQARTLLRPPGNDDADWKGFSVMAVSEGQAASSDAPARYVVARNLGQITGRVVDGEGRPIAEAFVDATRQSKRKTSGPRTLSWRWGRKPVLTDVDGSFTLAGLADGDYTVGGFLRTGGEAFVHDVPVGTTTTLKIVSSGSISGRIVTDGDMPETFGLVVQDHARGYHRREDFHRSGGTWRLDKLSPGNYTIGGIAEDGRGDGSVTVQLAAGQSVTDVELRLEPKATIVGRAIALSTGLPIANLRIDVSSREGRGGQLGHQDKATTDAQGRFRVEKSPSGWVALSVYNNTGDPELWYARVPLVTKIRPGTENDVGDVLLAKRRVEWSRRGDFGFTLQEVSPMTAPAARKRIVGAVRPGGPAASAGLQVDDQIIAVDGNDVTGSRWYLYRNLATVKPGVSVRFTLADGREVVMTAVPR